MASGETITLHPIPSMHEEDDFYDQTDDHHHLHNHHYNVSRLSMCTSDRTATEDDEDSTVNVSVEDSSEAVADGELSIDKERRAEREYGSESESRGQRSRRKRGKWPRRLERAWEMKRREREGMEEESNYSNNNNGSGESECMVIARPKGGRRSLCMDMNEIKACEDLGFDLQRECMLEIPTRASAPASTVDTDSGGNSPIASWRISSPGDDPKDVKDRLKVWAQAVALASTSRLNG